MKICIDVFQIYETKLDTRGSSVIVTLTQIGKKNIWRLLYSATSKYYIRNLIFRVFAFLLPTILLLLPYTILCLGLY